MTEAEARRLAQEQLDAMPDREYVITSVEEYDVGWVYFWDSRQHQQSGNFLDALGGNAPILVDRTDGALHFTGTARPTEEYIERYRRRDPEDERSWHP